MILKRYKDFINENYDEEFDDEYVDDWDGIARHEGNKEMYRVDNRMNYDLYDAHGDVELKMIDTDNKGKIVYTFVDEFDHKIEANGIDLTSLEGFPSSHAKDIRVDNNKLTNLKGSPHNVDDIFSCDNNLLTSLEGSPEEVEEFYARYNNHLTDLKGAPKIVQNMFDVSYCANLTSLEGVPKELNHIDLTGCIRLDNLKGLPNRIEGSIDIDGTAVYSLIDLVGKDLDDNIEWSGSKVSEVEVDFFFKEGIDLGKELYYPRFLK